MLLAPDWHRVRSHCTYPYVKLAQDLLGLRRTLSWLFAYVLNVKPLPDGSFLALGKYRLCLPIHRWDRLAIEPRFEWLLEDKLPDSSGSSSASVLSSLPSGARIAVPRVFVHQAHSTTEAPYAASDGPRLRARQDPLSSYLWWSVIVTTSLLRPLT